METINAQIHLDELGKPSSEFTHVSQLADEETSQCVGAALMLGCKLDELWAGNRHNTQQLIDMAAELTPPEGALAVDVMLGDFRSKLHMVGTSCGPLVVVADDGVGVLCTRAVANAILNRPQAPPAESEAGETQPVRAEGSYLDKKLLDKPAWFKRTRNDTGTFDGWSIWKGQAWYLESWTTPVPHWVRSLDALPAHTSIVDDGETTFLIQKVEVLDGAAPAST